MVVSEMKLGSEIGCNEIINLLRSEVQNEKTTWSEFTSLPTRVSVTCLLQHDPFTIEQVDIILSSAMTSPSRQVFSHCLKCYAQLTEPSNHLEIQSSGSNAGFS